MSIDIRGTEVDRRLLEQQRATQTQEPRATGSGTEDDAQSSRATRASDSIVISPEAKALAELDSAAQAAPEVDANRVEQIRKQIAEGRYHVDPQRLAQQIIDLERELLT